MQRKSPYKYLRDNKNINKLIDRKSFQKSPRLSINVQCQIDICPNTLFLTISKQTIVDIPPELTKPNLFMTKPNSISINPMGIYTSPSQQPSKNPPKFKPVFTAKDFKRCANKTEINRHKAQNHEWERERERDLATSKNC